MLAFFKYNKGTHYCGDYWPFFEHFVVTSRLFSSLQFRRQVAPSAPSFIVQIISRVVFYIYSDDNDDKDGENEEESNDNNVGKQD